MKRFSMSGLYAARRSAQSYLCARMKQPLRAVLVARPAVQEMAIPSPNQNPPPVARLAVQETNSKKRR